MRARLTQATGAASSQTSSLGGVEDLDHDDHVVLSVLDDGVGHNSELLRRSESNAASVVPKQRSSLSFLSLGGSSSKARKHIELGNPHGAGIALGGMADDAALSAATAAGGKESWRDREAGSDVHHGHERPSFRVIGVQISHMSRTGQFLFCTFGVFSFLLVYGFLQEYMVIHVFQRQLGIFLTLCQFAGYSSLAALHRLIHADTPRRIPLGYYVLLATLQATMQGLTNLSMRWLNYPAKMLFKSSRVIPTMIVGVFIMKKRYKMKDYMVVALLSLGLVFFIQADVKVSPSFHPLGIIFISMALVVDAAIVNIQEYTLRRYDASHDELIFYSYGIGSFILFAYCLFSMELYDGIVFLRSQPPRSTLCLIIFCFCGYFGVTCVAALTKKFGALASTMTTTARKALTLFLSFFIFPKPATGMHVFGGVLFVLGLSVKAVPTGRNKDYASSSSASSSIPSTSSAATLLSPSCSSPSHASMKSKQTRSLLSSSAAVPPSSSSSSSAAASAVATSHQAMGSIAKSIELV
ncbi:hypothetical protein VYU27_001945 [Nannochloropsis oceanica]